MKMIQQERRNALADAVYNAVLGVSFAVLDAWMYGTYTILYALARSRGLLSSEEAYLSGMWVLIVFIVVLVVLAFSNTLDNALRYRRFNGYANYFFGGLKK